MPRRVAALTEKEIKNAKPGDKPRRVFVGIVDGLHLLIDPDGSKYWRLKYQISGKEKRIGLGVYPDISLAQARANAAQERRKLREGIDPATERKETKEAKRKESANTFKAVALEWFERKRGSLAPATARKINEALTIDLIPALGHRPIATLTTPQVVDALHAIQTRSPHMASKARQFCGAIVRYAIRTGTR